MKYLTISPIFILVLFCFVSCKKEKVINNGIKNYGKHVDLVDIGNNEKVLKFMNSNELHETIGILSEMSDENRFLWEQQFSGFHSMSYIFNLIVKEESKIADSLEVDATRDPNMHTSLIYSYPNCIVTKTYEDVSFYDKNIAFEPFSWIANKDGAFFIGDTLYVMDENYLRYKINGNISDISYIRTFMESNNSLGIFVENIGTNKSSIFLDSKRTLLNGVHNFSTSNSSTNGRMKIILYQDYRQINGQFNNTVYAGFDATRTIFTVKSRSLQRRVLGLWYDNINADHEIFGNIFGGFLSEDTDQKPDPKSVGFEQRFAYNRGTNTNTVVLFVTPYGVSKKYLHTMTSDADNGKDCPEIKKSRIEASVSAMKTASCITSFN